MRTDVKCCILIYYNHDKKTFNPGLILTDTNLETEIIMIGAKMKEAGIDVNTSVLPAVDSVNDLPPLDQPVTGGLPGYEYDPFLIW